MQTPTKLICIHAGTYERLRDYGGEKPFNKVINELISKAEQEPTK